MIDFAHVQKWLDDYVSAWKAYDPQAIGALFSADATYRYNPYDDAVRGRETIVANWLDNRDAPGTYSASYEPVAINGNTAVTHGRSLYFDADGATLKRQFDNIFVLRFDDEGRCADFCEWYMEPRGQR